MIVLHTIRIMSYLSAKLHIDGQLILLFQYNLIMELVFLLYFKPNIGLSIIMQCLFSYGTFQSYEEDLMLYDVLLFQLHCQLT